MSAPDRIFLQVDGPETEFGVTWCVDQIDESDVEYVRARCASRDEAQALVNALEREIEEFNEAEDSDGEDMKLAFDRLVSALYPTKSDPNLWGSG